MDPTAFIYEFDVRQMVSDVGQPAWVHRDVHGPTLCVVAILCSTHGGVQCLTTEAGVDVNGLVEVLPEGFQHFGAQTHEVVHFDRIDAVFYMLLLSGVAVKHFFEGKVFAELHKG